MRIFISLFISISLFLFCAAAYAQDADSAPAGESVHISDVEGLALATTLANTGHMEEAKQIYWLLIQSNQPEISLEAVFSLGLIAIAEREYKRAIEYFTAILNQYPKLARVRLELARAYFQNEDYDDARFHFELVKGGTDIPPEVIANVDIFLDAIRRQKNWSVNFGFSIIPDSNISQISGGEECVMTIFGLMCKPLGDKRSGVGGRLTLGGDYYLKFNKNFGVRNSLALYATEYPGKQFDDYILYAATGPRYIFESGEVSVQGSYMHRWIGHRPYSDTFGLRIDSFKDFGRLMVSSGASIGWNSYEGPANDALHGQEYRVYVRPRYILTSQSYIHAGVDFTQDNTRVSSHGSDQWRFSLGGYYFFKYGFSLSAELSLADYRYHAPQWYVTQGYYYDSTTRRDRVYSFQAELSTNLFEKNGIRPKLEYTYTRRDSNIWSREYSRHRVNFLMEFKF